jgi:hypothetical protein
MALSPSYPMLSNPDEILKIKRIKSRHIYDKFKQNLAVAKHKLTWLSTPLLWSIFVHYKVVKKSLIRPPHMDTIFISSSELETEKI